MQSYAHARRDTRILAQTPVWCVQVKHAGKRKQRGIHISYTPHIVFVADTCQVQNGGCDVNAVCSHDGTSNAVVCTCKTGYTSTGSAPYFTCTGENPASTTESCLTNNPSLSRILIDTCQVSNGGCDANAVCSHDSNTNAVTCACKSGYSNTGNTSNVVCTGQYSHSCSMIDINSSHWSDLIVVDSCQVNNGGCDSNAICSHDSKSNGVVCTCKTGYSNTGSASNVICTGLSAEAVLAV